MQFIADNMLGKLAKWLRFLGYDILYPKTSDSALVQLSRAEDRMLLTRDKELVKRKNLKVLYIPSDKLDEQLAQVINEFDLKITTKAFSRCPECNNLIKKIDKSEVMDKVPQGVYANQEKFWLCTKCNRYYWHGTHYDKIKSKFDALFQ
jgi:uncharacterized protein with PIN domain